MIKAKLFDIGRKNSDQINEWLEQNPDIAILSTNSFSNQAGWGYIILYDDITAKFDTSNERRRDSK